MFVIKIRVHEKYYMFPVVRKKKEMSITHEINPNIMIS